MGEKLPAFKVAGVYDDQAGKELDFVIAAGEKPILLIFVHKLTRPSAAVARALATYGQQRSKDGLTTGIVWLGDDASAAEQYLKRARGSLQLNVPVGISHDGVEGPGSYGLNRNVTLTILVGKEGRVTANFALIQPSVTEIGKILEEVVAVAGGEVPSEAELAKLSGQSRRAMARPAMRDPELTEKLRAFIQKDNSDEQVAKLAAELDKFVAENKAARQQLGDIAGRVVNSGKLENYGTPAAQEQLKKWAQAFGSENPEPRERPQPKSRENRSEPKQRES